MRQFIQNRFLLLGLLLLLGIGIGWMIKPTHHSATPDQRTVMSGEELQDQIWTCAMHPQIRRHEPGKCPICGMDLIPLDQEIAGQENPMVVTMSPTAMQLASIETSVVSRQKPVKEIRLNGKVQADERKIYSQASHIPGRIEQLLINYNGEQIQKGQLLAYVYSPELINAQEELFVAKKIRDQQPLLFSAAKDKLKNWKLTDEQIDQIIAQGQPQERFPVLSDVSGIVLNKRVNTGDHVMTGMTLYDVADLSSVWVLFDVYESDISWVKIRDKVDFTVNSLPGEKFSGNVSFIDPMIDPQTRVAKARVEIANAGRKLKPEMFTSGVIRSELRQAKTALVIPKSAVMWTGTRSVVYVKTDSITGVSFVMREVTLGPALGDSYVIKDGLQEGEEIATHGTFSIDAAAQLAGKPSMMNPRGEPAMSEHHHGEPTSIKDNRGSTAALSGKEASPLNISDQLSPLFARYLALKNNLVLDDLGHSKEEASLLLGGISMVNEQMFTGQHQTVWMNFREDAKTALSEMTKASDIAEVRQYFKPLSNSFIRLAEAFGPMDQALYILHCPMADHNQGADWISGEKQVRNPYFGSAMISCGALTKEIK